MLYLLFLKDFSYNLYVHANVTTNMDDIIKQQNEHKQYLILYTQKGANIIQIFAEDGYHFTSFA